MDAVERVPTPAVVVERLSPLGFQLCPKCNGEGRIQTTGLSTSAFAQCPVCMGKMIISVVTGWPPP